MDCACGTPARYRVSAERPFEAYACAEHLAGAVGAVAHETKNESVRVRVIWRAAWTVNGITPRQRDLSAKHGA